MYNYSQNKIEVNAVGKCLNLREFCELILHNWKGSGFHIFVEIKGLGVNHVQSTYTYIFIKT